MAKLLHTSKTNPCPICTKTNGNCRLGDEGKVLCMTFTDGDAGHPDYRWTKPSKDYHWGVFVPRTSSSESLDRERWLKEVESRRHRTQKKLAHALSETERDREFRQLLAQLSLTEADQQRLQRRGLTLRQIEEGLYRSVSQGQRLSPALNPRLSGVKADGQSLLVGGDGILIPIFNGQGQIIGAQVRITEPKNGNKYPWLPNPHLCNGELPIGIYHPQILKTPRVIGLCEGFLKANIASQLVGIPFIGAAGGNHASSSVQFQTYIQSAQPSLSPPPLPSDNEDLITLKSLLALTGSISPSESLVIDFPDAGYAVNKAVLRTLQRRLRFLERLDLTVLVADWNQANDKEIGDIDEISPETIANIQYLSLTEFFQLYPDSDSPLHCFQDWVTRQVRRVKRGFGLKPEGQAYAENRIEALFNALDNHQYVLDASPPGDGKSHSIAAFARLALEKARTIDPEAKVWIMSEDYRNPTVEALKEFVAMPTRHQGLILHKSRLVRASEGTAKSALAVQGNCIQPEQFNRLAALGYNPHEGGGDNPVCAACPVANVCKSQEGWFRHERREALAHGIIRCHPSQIPPDRANHHDYIIWDEPSRTSPVRILDTTWAQLLVEQDRVRPSLPDALWQQLDYILQWFKPKLDPVAGYGKDHDQLLADCPDFGSLDRLIEEMEAYQTELGELFLKPADSIDSKENLDGLTVKEKRRLQRRISDVNRFWRHEASRATEANLALLPTNALLSLLKAIRGDAGIDMRLKSDQLILTLDRRADFATIRTNQVIFFDATLSGDRLQHLLNLGDPPHVIRRRTGKPLRNQTVVQIKTKGWGSTRVSKKAINRVRELVKTLHHKYGAMPVMGYKALLEMLDLDGYWFRDNRGSNEYAGLPYMLSVGLPLPNVGALKSEYRATRGTLEGFDDYYQRLVSEEVLQMVGRQRANRYPERDFTHFFVTPHDYDMSWLEEYGATVISIDAFEVTPTAGDETQLARWRLIEAIQQAQKLSVTAIAEILQVTRQAVHHILKTSGITLQDLASLISEKVSSSPSKNSIGATLHFSDFSEQLREFLKLDTMHLIAEAIQSIQILGWQDYQTEILFYLPKSIQCLILGHLWHLFTESPPT